MMEEQDSDPGRTAARPVPAARTAQRTLLLLLRSWQNRSLWDEMKEQQTRHTRFTHFPSPFSSRELETLQPFVSRSKRQKAKRRLE